MEEANEESESEFERPNKNNVDIRDRLVVDGHRLHHIQLLPIIKVDDTRIVARGDTTHRMLYREAIVHKQDGSGRILYGEDITAYLDAQREIR